jgi:lipid-A-disaccharide synthase
VGHPLLDHVHPSGGRESLRKEFEIPLNQKVIGLLPGSRKSEVERILPIMVKAASFLKQSFPEAVFFLGESPNVSKPIYERILQNSGIGIRRFQDRFYDHVAIMDFALVTSGTATLEVALVGTPFFLLYKTSWSTYILGRQLIQVPYLGLVNLLAQKKVIPEFIQNDAHPETIAHEAKIFLQNPELLQAMQEEFRKVREKLGEKGVGRRAAQAVMESLR